MPCSTITKPEKIINYKIYKKELPNSVRRGLVESTKSSTFRIAELCEYEINAYLHKKYVESVYNKINFFINEPCSYYHIPNTPVYLNYEDCFIMQGNKERFCPRCTILSNLFQSPVISIDTKTNFWNAQPCHVSNIPDYLFEYISTDDDCFDLFQDDTEKYCHRCTVLSNLFKSPVISIDTKTNLNAQPCHASDIPHYLYEYISTDDDCFVIFKHNTEKYCYRCANLLKSDSVNTECIDQSPTYISILDSKKGGKRDGSTWRRKRTTARPSRVDIKRKNKYHHESLSFF